MVTVRSSLLAGFLALVSTVDRLVLGYELKTPPLDTPWTTEVGTNPWPEYPRPQLRRPDWQTLNGVWKWQEVAAGQENTVPEIGAMSEEVLVPSCLESGLSGIMEQGKTYSWFAREFEVPTRWSNNGQRVLLNFEAVDYEATVYVNGQNVGSHTGGYWHFSFDITQFLAAGTNTLQVHVFDPTDDPEYGIPVGKQVRSPSHIWYTPCTGIWQSVWIEPVPENYITQLDISANMDGVVNMTVHASNGSSSEVEVTITDAAGVTTKTARGSPNEAFDFEVESPTLWSPDTPKLYNLTVKMGNDEAVSYTGFRTISVGEINGVKRPLINGEFFFHFGTLDQGFWPDGLYTPPTYEAMVYDLQVLKDVGANMLRKHIKVESSLYYHACDQIGLLVIQDMPSLPGSLGGWTPNAAQQEEWERQFDILINQFKSFPSIYTWVIYNEGWGQIVDGYFPEFDIVTRIKQLDPTRLVNAVTGWWDHGAGDYDDNHHYANPQCGTPFYSLNSGPYDSSRIAIQGEFGGIGLNTTEDHLWKVQAAIDTINQTYEIHETSDTFNYRSHLLLDELRWQVEQHACSAAVWTQTTDVEGEVNGFMTYDRRITRIDVDQWRADIQALYDAAKARSGYKS
ncbi:glycoside hydrolase family 2 protein [Biscogniauxia mediterranea]|nr:glycoside hydrolase family 2 protein [Biscogniauxia mediterranea]